MEDGEKYVINYDSERRSHYIYNHTQENMDILPSDPLIPPMEDTDNLNDDIDLQDLAMRDLDELVTIDLMIVYTPAAVEWAQQSGGIDNIIAQAMGSSQLVLDNSNVNIHLRLVHSQMIEYRESMDAVLDLERITYPSDGYMDEVHELRDAYGADLVAFVGDIEYSGCVGWLLQSIEGSQILLLL